LESKDRLDRESAEFHTKVKQAFRDLAKANPDRYIVIDAAKPIDEIAELVFKAFKVKRK
jgi:dTMP kinase